jgi:hypothetical protein
MRTVKCRVMMAAAGTAEGNTESSKADLCSGGMRTVARPLALHSAACFAAGAKPGCCIPQRSTTRARRRSHTSNSVSCIPMTTQAATFALASALVHNFSLGLAAKQAGMDNPRTSRHATIQVCAAREVALRSLLIQRAAHSCSFAQARRGVRASWC